MLVGIKYSHFLQSVDGSVNSAFGNNFYTSDTPDVFTAKCQSHNYTIKFAAGYFRIHVFRTMLNRFELAILIFSQNKCARTSSAATPCLLRQRISGAEIDE